MEDVKFITENQDDRVLSAVNKLKDLHGIEMNTTETINGVVFDSLSAIEKLEKVLEHIERKEE